jgi:uncharacterized protein YggE
LTTIAVAGDATTSVRPERGIVTVSIGYTAEDREVAVVAAAEAHAAVAGQAQQHIATRAATWYSADPVWASPYAEYVKDSDTKVVRHRAGSTVRVKFQDFAVLSEWLVELALNAGVTTSVHWALTETTRKETEQAVRNLAVQDAVERAAAYATFVGTADPVLVAIFEPDLRPNIGESLSMYGAGAVGGGIPSFELTPQDIDVTASVTADFTV